MNNLFALRVLRNVVPIASSLAFIFLVWRLQYPLPPETVSLLWLSRLDPLLFLSQWRLTEALPTWFWLPIIVVILTILFGRVFCGWLCPLGGLLIQLPTRNNYPNSLRWFHERRYIWLLGSLTVLLFGSNWPLLITPFHLLTAEYTRIWLEKVPWLLLVTLLVGILLFPRFWCTYVCPTGILLATLSRWRPFRLTIDHSCIGCGFCNIACQTKSVRYEEGRITEDCVLCGRCWQICPTGAIKWCTADMPVKRNISARVDLSRRQLLMGSVMITVAGVSGVYLMPMSDTVAAIRPPGALPENEFVSKCSRCGRCIKVCPANALLPMPIEQGIITFLTPRLIPRQAKCELCLLCQQVCPTGAISQMPLSSVKMGEAELDRKKCLVWVEQKLCLLCREQCPVHAIEVDDYNQPIVNGTLCVGCGACENGCPLAEPAIVVHKS